MLKSYIVIFLAYFIGAIPSGYWIGKVFYKVNLKKEGSKNIGATNAYRVLGKKAGAAVFICDVAKGFIAASLGSFSPEIALYCAVAALIGNNWSIFLKFKSGKGVACGLGAFTYLCSLATLAAFIVWLVIFLWKKIVSLASIISVPFVPLVMYFAEKPWQYVLFSVLAGILVIFKHKSNIERLIKGEEKQIIK